MFKKLKKNPKDNLRATKRVSENEIEGDVTESKRARNATYDDESSEDEDLHHPSTFHLLEQAKLDQKNQTAKGVLSSSSTASNKKDFRLIHEFKPNEKQDLSGKDMATRAAEFHPEEPKRRKDEGDTSLDNDPEMNIKLYKGLQEKRNKFLAGPLKAPTFVRTTARFDYQPDICKDYKETGFCGFGDSCIYLHDRGNSLSGWQLEQEYEKKKKEDQDKKQKEMELFCQEISGKQLDGTDGNELSIVTFTDDGIPFACHLCRSFFCGSGGDYLQSFFLPEMYNDSISKMSNLPQRYEWCF